MKDPQVEAGNPGQDRGEPGRLAGLDDHLGSRHARDPRVEPAQPLGVVHDRVRDLRAPRDRRLERERWVPARKPVDGDDSADVDLAPTAECGGADLAPELAPAEWRAAA